MDFKLMYITNDESLARIADDSGVDWVFIDLEINGKEARQGHLDTVISRHSIEDVKKIKPILKSSKLLVRVNPIFENSEEEINRVIKDGADIVMLPFFKNHEEVQKFVDIVNGNAKTCLLLETKEAVEDLDNILSIKGIDYIHIGLNDLHLSYNMKFMFEPLSVGLVDEIINKIKQKDIKYGFGGIAALGKGDLPSEYVLNEHIRLGSTMAILSRTFYRNDGNKNNLNLIFAKGINDIRNYILDTKKKDEDFLKNSQKEANKMIETISKNKKGNN